jgi:hypothetical protein
MQTVSVAILFLRTISILRRLGNSPAQRDETRKPDARITVLGKSVSSAQSVVRLTPDGPTKIQTKTQFFENGRAEGWQAVAKGG